MTEVFPEAQHAYISGSLKHFEAEIFVPGDANKRSQAAKICNLKCRYKGPFGQVACTGVDVGTGVATITVKQSQHHTLRHRMRSLLNLSATCGITLEKVKPPGRSSG